MSFWHPICKTPILSDDKVEKSAEKMFEENGFHLIADTDYVLIYKKDDMSVTFNLIDKGYYVQGFKFITIDLLEIIIKQCKELGWLH